MVIDVAPVGPHFPKFAKFMRILPDSGNGTLDTIIQGKDYFLPEPVIPVHSGNQAKIWNGNNLTTNTL